MFYLYLASTKQESSTDNIFDSDLFKMAKSKASGQGKPAKGKGKGKGKGKDQDKSDTGGKEESTRDHKWGDDHDEIQVRHILW